MLFSFTLALSIFPLHTSYSSDIFMKQNVVPDMSVSHGEATYADFKFSERERKVKSVKRYLFASARCLGKEINASLLHKNMKSLFSKGK